MRKIEEGPPGRDGHQSRGSTATGRSGPAAPAKAEVGWFVLSFLVSQKKGRLGQGGKRLRIKEYPARLGLSALQTQKRSVGTSVWVVEEKHGHGEVQSAIDSQAQAKTIEPRESPVGKTSLKLVEKQFSRDAA